MEQSNNRTIEQKKVLFLGMTDFKLTNDDKSLEKKLTSLSRDLDVHILARGNQWQTEKYGCRFFLTPKKYGIILWFLISFFRGLNIIRKYKIDTIICQSPSVDGLLASVLKLFTRRELIMEVHGDWIENLFFYHKVPCPGLVKYGLITMGRISLKSANKVRVISSFTEKLAKKYSGEKPYYKFPTFTDIDVFLNAQDTSWEPEILYVGVLYRLKGVHFLIKALKKIQDKHPEVKLVIVGEGPYKEDLDKLIKEQGVKNVEFTGWLYIDEVKDKMKSCTTLVLPSLSEGLGRVLIEAAALGKPIIGSNTGGIPDIVHDNNNGYLFEPGDVDLLAEKLNLVFSDIGKAKAMGARGKELMAKQFSTKKFFYDYINMINDGD